jgi:hypothetical protein
MCISHKVFGRYITGHKRCKICDLFKNGKDYGARAADVN